MREALARKRAMAGQGLLSAAELSTAETEVKLAELETLRAQINYTNELPSFRIVSAKKSAPPGGPLSVELELAALPMTHADGVRQYLVSLRDGKSIIGEPYQATLTVHVGDPPMRRLQFRLLKDADEVTIVILSGARSEEIPILLQREGADRTITVRAQNFSQEAALDDKADFTLELERFSSGLRDVRFLVTGVPEEVSYEWIDSSTKAKLSSFRFSDGQNSAKVILRLYVPTNANPKWFGQLVPFRATIQEGDRVVGQIDLQVRFVGAPKLALAAENLLVSIDRRDVKDLVLTVENTGGVAARDVRIEADPPIGFDVSITPAMVPAVEPNRRARIGLRLTVSQDAVPGDYNMKVRAVSVTKLANVVSPEQSYRLVLRTGSSWMYLGFGAPLLASAFAAWLLLRKRRRTAA
ncbi:MAG: NEW3 domain-containing protein [Acidobacteriota bacterium]